MTETAVERNRVRARENMRRIRAELKAADPAGYKAQRHAEYLAARERHPELAERARVATRAYYQTHRAEILAVKRPRGYDPALSAACTANKTAAEYGCAGRLTAQDVRDLWARQPDCLHCGEGRGVDHIENLSDHGPNLPGNLQNLCRSCNSRKFQAAKRKLSADQIRGIRLRRQLGVPRSAIAREVGVSHSLIWQIEVGRAYTWVPA